MGHKCIVTLELYRLQMRSLLSHRVAGPPPVTQNTCPLVPKTLSLEWNTPGREAPGGADRSCVHAASQQQTPPA
jgi:hypothetical protein